MSIINTHLGIVPILHPEIENEKLLIDFQNVEREKKILVEKILNIYTPEFYQNWFKNNILPKYKTTENTFIHIEFDYIKILTPTQQYILFFDNGLNYFQIIKTENKSNTQDIIKKCKKYEVVQIMKNIINFMGILEKMGKLEANNAN
jgi:hypothetical protein